MTVTELIADSQERMLTELQAGQERIVEANKQMAEAVKGMIPTEMFDSASLPAMPGMGELPEPAEMIDGYFDFAAKVSDISRTFYKDMVAVWTPEKA